MMYLGILALTLTKLDNPIQRWKDIYCDVGSAQLQVFGQKNVRIYAAHYRTEFFKGTQR
jgi:hypothetical protein